MWLNRELDEYCSLDSENLEKFCIYIYYNKGVPEPVILGRYQLDAWTLGESFNLEPENYSDERQCYMLCALPDVTFTMYTIFSEVSGDSWQGTPFSKVFHTAALTPLFSLRWTIIRLDQLMKSFYRTLYSHVIYNKAHTAVSNGNIQGNRVQPWRRVSPWDGLPDN